MRGRTVVHALGLPFALVMLVGISDRAVAQWMEERSQVQQLEACVPAGTTLCLDDQVGDRRFKIEVDWQTAQSGGQSGKGNAVPAAPIGFTQGGIFWFFSSTNPEMLVKVINGCSVNDKYWVFASAGTNVGLTVTVTDVVTGAVKTYTNPDVTAAQPVQDTAAFGCGGAPSEITVDLPGGVPLEMLKIPGSVSLQMLNASTGTFEMGSPESERGRVSDEGPVHLVTLTSDYFLGKYEVTQGQWLAVMGTAMPTNCGAYGVGASYPVYCVRWTDIAGPGGFLEKLNAHLTATGQAGAGKYRLPTEAEWERASRGGTQTRFSFGDALAGDDVCGLNAAAEPYVWWCANSGSATHPVGTKGANQYGLHDMHGNVWEWVSDWYGSYGPSEQTDPMGPATGSSRIFRGGSWLQGLDNSRSAFRYEASPLFRGVDTGFRLARSF